MTLLGTCGILLIRKWRFSGAGQITLSTFSFIGKAFVKLQAGRIIMPSFCLTSAGVFGRKGTTKFLGIERSWYYYGKEDFEKHKIKPSSDEGGGS